MPGKLIKAVTEGEKKFAKNYEKNYRLSMRDVKKNILSIILPVFNEEEILEISIDRILKFSDKIKDKVNTEIIFVNDGSNDRSLEILKKYKEKLKIISFTRNFGHQMAITAGIDHATGDYISMVDADLQDPPELIEDMYDLCASNKYDFVYGVRKKRKGETYFKKVTANIFYKIINRLSDTKINLNSGDFALLSKKTAIEFRNLREKNRFIRGMLPWLGFKSTSIEYERSERVAGTTKYPFFKMLSFAQNAIFSLSNKPLTFAVNLGVFTIMIGIIISTYYLFLKLFTDLLLPGFAAIMITIIIFSGVQIFLIGIVGEYIARIFEETKNRPLYVIDEVVEPDQKNI